MSRRFGGQFGENNLWYGIDKPTGGFFWQELTPSNEECAGRDRLTLTQLLADLLEYKHVGVSPDILVQDFFDAEAPSRLQIDNGTRFGYDILDMLDDVKLDIIYNFSDCFLPKYQ
jgi:hypothetical protein